VKLADLHMHGCKYLDVLIAHYGQSTVADRSPYVDGEKLKREWKDCSLMMHSDRSLSLADFCKLLISTPQYVEDYANMTKLAYIALIIPVTSVECERGFSMQNRIKTKFRSRIQNPTLNSLMKLAYFSNSHFCDDSDYFSAG
jgi:hypothetical protein